MKKGSLLGLEKVAEHGSDRKTTRRFEQYNKKKGARRPEKEGMIHRRRVSVRLQKSGMLRK